MYKGGRLEYLLGVCRQSPWPALRSRGWFRVGQGLNIQWLQWYALLQWLFWRALWALLRCMSSSESASQSVPVCDATSCYIPLQLKKGVQGERDWLMACVCRCWGCPAGVPGGTERGSAMIGVQRVHTRSENSACLVLI